MDEINVVVAGAAGEGVQTIGAILGDAVSAQGYAEVKTVTPSG